MIDRAKPVLVTGGSGFVAAHIILQLLQDGHRVRTTVRSAKREPDVRHMLERAGADTAPLSCVAADLTADDGWQAAVAGATTSCTWHPRFHRNSPRTPTN